MAKVIIVDEKLCMACKSCVIQCAMAHTDASSIQEAVRSDNPPQPRLYIEAGEQFGMPLQCRHCEDAPCMMVCPTEAISRTSAQDPVILDQQQCIGCKFCMQACPFGVIDISRDHKAVIKCDLCIELTQAGEDPACVTACPTRSLKFVELDDFLRDQRRQVAAMLAGKQEALANGRKS